MRIIQITPRYFPNMGGVEEVVQKISETLVNRGVQVVVFSVDRTSGLPRGENIEGVLVKRFVPLFSDPLYFPEPSFVASLRKEKADVVHVHNIHTLPPLIAAMCKRGDQKLLLQPHYHRYGQSPFRHSFLELYKRMCSGLIFSKTDVVLANSAYEKEALCEDFPEVRNVFLLPEGIDFDGVVRVKHEPVEPRRILYVGALKHYKNVDKILRGFSNLLKKGEKRFQLVVIGEGPERDSLVNLAEHLRISEFVEWKCRLSREELLSEYAKASVLVQLSPLESFSRVVYDALFVGVPVVVLDFGAFKDLVAEGFAEGVKSLAEADIADALLKATKKTYARISMDGNAFLDWKTYSDRLIDVYEKLIGT